MFKNIAKIFTSHIVVKTIGLANIAFVLFFLSVKDFGEYSYLFLLLNLVAVIIDPLLSAYLVDSITLNYKKYNFGILIISLILTPFFYFFINFFYNKLSVTLFILFSATYFISAILKSYLNSKERYYNYGIVDVVRQLSVFCTTVFFFYFLNSNSYIELLEFNYLVSFIGMILIAIIFLKKEEIEFIINFSRLKKQTFQSKFLIFYTALIPFISFIDSYFVDAYLTKDDLGIYSFSLKVYNISLMLVVPIFTVLNIKQIEIAKEGNYMLFVKKSFKKVIFFSSMIFLVTLLFNWLITNYIYLEYKSSFWNTNILLFGSFITYITLPFSFLIAYRKYRYLFALGIIAVLFNILINYFFIEKYGMLVASFSTFLCQIIINLGAATISFFLLRNSKNEN
jgi:O-antigen/teichoic acid export membrane protein